MNTEDIPDFLKGRSPEESRKNPFQVPDNYFDSFPNRVQTRILSKAKKNNVPFFLSRSLLRPVGMMSVCIVLILTGIFTYRSFNNKPDVLTNEEIAFYINQQGLVDDLDETELILISNYGNGADKQKTEAEKEAEVIQRYLLEEGIEMNDIINEL